MRSCNWITCMLVGGFLTGRTIAGNLINDGDLLSRGGGGPYSTHFHLCQLGDYDYSRALDVADLQLMRPGLTENNRAFDIDGDGEAGIDDWNAWVHDLKRTWFGDTDLDGQFDSTDLVIALAAGEYEDPVHRNSS